MREKRCLWNDLGVPVSVPAPVPTTLSSSQSCNITDESNLPDENDQLSKKEEETFNDVWNHYVQPAPVRPFWHIVSNSLVVAQEFILSAYLLARQRVDTVSSYSMTSTRRLQWSALFLWLAMMCISYWSASSQGVSRSQKARQRLVDACWLGLLLRLWASVLYSLTASYSSDTVHTLAGMCMLLHLFSCDYSYANGYCSTPATTMTKNSSNDSTNIPSTPTTTTNIHTNETHIPVQPHRPLFQGGTLSLNAALFATLLWASRLSDHVQAYGLVMLAIVLCAFFPASRHIIAHCYPCHEHGTLLADFVVACNVNMGFGL
jgi:hypothetical protein